MAYFLIAKSCQLPSDIYFVYDILIVVNVTNVLNSNFDKIKKKNAVWTIFFALKEF